MQVHRDYALERAKEAHKRFPLVSYLDRGDALMYCKCGQLIKGGLARTLGGPYTEIEILFTDGSKHETPVCKDCVARRFSPDQLNDIYAIDMEMWATEEDLDMGPVNWDLNAHRVAMSWRELKGR